MNGEPEARLPGGQAALVPGSLTYARLAEAGYLTSAAFALADVILLALLHVTGFSFGLAETLASAAIAFVLSVAWFQLGRKQEVAWFIAAGAFGAVSAVLSLIVSLWSSSPIIGFWVAISLVEVIVSLVYFAVQLLAFYTAAKKFQVRPFMYAAYLLAIGFVVSPIIGVLLVTPTSNFQPLAGETASHLAYGIGLIIAAGSALAAALGFHRLGRNPGPETGPAVAM